MLAVAVDMFQRLFKTYWTFERIIRSIALSGRTPELIKLVPGKGPIRTEWSGVFLGEAGLYRFGLSYEVHYTHSAIEEPREYREELMRAESSEHTILDQGVDYERKVRCALVAEERAEVLRKQFPEARVIVMADPVTLMNDELRANLHQEAARLGLVA